MKKIIKLRICDWLLMFMLVSVLASSILLEAIGSGSIAWVWVHIVLSIIFILIIGWHLFLHFQWRGWAKLLIKQKSPVTRLLAVFYALTIISAAVAFIHWLGVFSHSPIGGVHGKIGFIFAAICIGHTIKRLKSPVLKDRK